MAAVKLYRPCVDCLEPATHLVAVPFAFSVDVEWQPVCPRHDPSAETDWPRAPLGLGDPTPALVPVNPSQPSLGCYPMEAR